MQLPSEIASHHREKRERAIEFVRDLQDRITRELERVDGAATFQEEFWERPGGGGGRTRVIQNGGVFEKGGVNTSTVFGEFPKEFAKTLPGEGGHFFATGISLVIHPKSPMVPTVHMNYRFIQHGSAFWYGGGQDLTPYYVFDEDCIHFHKTIKEALDQHDTKFYPDFKLRCDEYFYNHHREEPRGIGGIFFDYIEDEKFESAWKEAGDAFLGSYVPIVEKRKHLNYGEREVDFQLYRRGRYVEFNLIHDRGTLFGLKTKGNIESILMSLPAHATWKYKWSPEPGSREEALYRALEKKSWE